MTSPEPSTPLNEIRNEGTSNQNTTNQSIIEGHLSALRDLLKEPSNRELIKPMLLNFNDDAEETDEEVEEVIKKKRQRKISYRGPKRQKEINGGRRRFNQTIQGTAKMPLYQAYYQVIISKAHVTSKCQNLRRHSSRKCPELSKRFSDSKPKKVDEMLKRVDDYVRLEEAFFDIGFTRKEFQRKEGVGDSLGFRQAKSPSEGCKEKEKGRQKGNGPQKGKVINMVRCVEDDQKRKSIMVDEDWMNVPIMFPPVRVRDHPEEAIMVEAEIEVYMVRQIHVDGGHP
ncbi:hypothetical protein Tco_1410010 [Tanacetum coccineum]